MKYTQHHIKIIYYTRFIDPEHSISLAVRILRKHPLLQRHMNIQNSIVRKINYLPSLPSLHFRSSSDIRFLIKRYASYKQIWRTSSCINNNITNNNNREDIKMKSITWRGCWGISYIFLTEKDCFSERWKMALILRADDFNLELLDAEKWKFMASTPVNLEFGEEIGKNLWNDEVFTVALAINIIGWS